MLYFTLIMLLLGITAQYRGPVLTHASIVWFFISWLPGELPWFFAAMQITGTATFLLLSSTIGLKEIFSILIAVVSVVIWFHLHAKTWRARQIFQIALRDLPNESIGMGSPENPDLASLSVIYKRDWLKPFWYRRKGVERIKNIPYGDAQRNQLDIYRAIKRPRSCPVLLHVHGGAWMVGNKHQQAQPLINHLTQRGWICVDINYRLAPAHLYPDCLVDVKKAIVWIKENISNYGGNPNFIAITGESAGGHLSALAALTANNPAFQPGFETSDTHVQAAVFAYGVYNVTSDDAIRGFLEKYVMPNKNGVSQNSWRAASPVFQITADRPPIFVIHGDKDCVVPVQQARHFVQALREKNNAGAFYAELPGAQHGFDIFHSVRTEFHIDAVNKFLHSCYMQHLLQKTLQKTDDINASK